MKKRAVFLSILLAAVLLLVCVSAAGGDAGDPLASLEYLRGVFLPKAETAVQEKLDASGNAVYEAAETKWRAAVAGAEAAIGSERAVVWTEARLKQGDVLSGLTGMQVTVLAGDVRAQFSSGAVIDVTDGTELTSGAALRTRHRYMTAEDTIALFTVSSRTAVVDYCGDYRFTLSASSPDYSAMASALKTLSLFKGNGTGYGEGFDLEVAPTRIQALVMLIRLLGEEGEALACTSPAPFKDISADFWGRPYIAYAYEKGYTNGMGDGKFSPDSIASEGMYVEFVLRALGYSDTTQTDTSTAVDRAFSAGILTAGERAALRANEFLRADIAYLSWYALGAPLPGGFLTLHEKLETAGVFTPDAYRRAGALVTSERL